MATDNLILIGPRELVEEELAMTNVEIPAVVGEGGISREKDILAQRLEAIGFMIDTVRGVMYLSQKAFASLIEIFLNLVVPVAGTTIPTPRLQRIASLAIRYSQFFPLLLPLSRGFSACTSPLSPSSVLSPRAVVDWQMWRAMMSAAISDPAWFEIHCSQPLLFSSFFPETDDALAQRQAAVADRVLRADAGTVTAGIGVFSAGSYCMLCS